jgi:hypothetical protein
MILLTDLIKKDLNFLFNDNCQEAFKNLKERLTGAPILALFNPEKEVTLETDTSDRVIGAYIT